MAAQRTMPLVLPDLIRPVPIHGGRLGGGGGQCIPPVQHPAPDLPLASASSDMIGWSRVLLSHTLDAARSY